MKGYPIFHVIKQEYPVTAKPYRIHETYWTSDGPRSRLCEGIWTTLGGAMEELGRRQQIHANLNEAVAKIDPVRVKSFRG